MDSNHVQAAHLAKRLTGERAEPVSRSAVGTYPAPLRYLLRLPLYYKLIIANGAITLTAVLACSAIVAKSVRQHPQAGVGGDVWTIVLIAAVVGILVNAAVVRLALLPLRDLAQAADRVRAGSYSARAALSSISDAPTEQVITAFNDMLDSVSMYRRRLQEIAIRAVDAAESERARLSTDLHDGVAQSLAASLVLLRITRTSTDPETAKLLTEIGEQLSNSINELRTFAQSLRPPAIDMIGVGPAIGSFARRITDTTSVRVQLETENIEGLLSKPAQLTLYRLIQEAVQNVVQHARTSSALVEIARAGNSIEARISDRGRGFNVQKALDDGALGLYGMLERAMYVGGRVDIHSVPGDGTTVRISIPIRDAENV